MVAVSNYWEDVREVEVCSQKVSFRKDERSLSKQDGGPIESQGNCIQLAILSFFEDVVIIW